ncbi:hypothetical protein VP01_1926g2 [Puccinia sorghi]|uniref:Uncharacterized protein n=1 Tax=Puccinia sorghi TaxID=27349 RepID=A0A0L6VD27_9BASI|nr:hypothetical protein VP01_1926g2 [Puccinia sorghi]
MARWPFSANGKLFLFFMIHTQHMVNFTIKGAPMRPPPVSSPTSPSFYQSISDAGNSAIHEGYSLVQTVQPSLYPVLKHNVVPVAYADQWSCDYYPATLITTHLVPNVPLVSPYDVNAKFSLRPNAIPYEPCNSKKQTGKLRTYYRKGSSIARNSLNQERASGRNSKGASKASVARAVPPPLVGHINQAAPVYSPVLPNEEKCEKPFTESKPASPGNSEQGGSEKQAKNIPYAPEKNAEQKEFYKLLNRAGIIPSPTSAHSNISPQTTPNEINNPQSQLENSVTSTAVVGPAVVSSGGTYHPENNIRRSKSAVSAIKDPSSRTSIQQTESEKMNEGKLTQASQQNGGEKIPKTTTNGKDLSPDKKEEAALVTADTKENRDLDQAKYSSVTKTPFESTTSSDNDSVRGVSATPILENKDHSASENDVGSPKDEPKKRPGIPAKDNGRIPDLVQTPVESYKSALLKKIDASETPDKPEPITKHGQQISPILQTMRTQDTAKLTTALPNNVIDSQKAMKQDHPALLSSGSWLSEPRTSENIFVRTTEVKDRTPPMKNTSKEKEIFSGTAKSGNDVGGTVLNKRVQSVQESKKFPWKVLNSPPELHHTDSASSERGLSIKETSSVRNQDSLSQDLRKQKSTEDQSTVPNSEKQVANKDREEKTRSKHLNETSRSVLSDMRDVLTLESRSRMDQEQLIYQRLSLAFHPAEFHLEEDEVFPGIKRPASRIFQEDPAIDSPLVTQDFPVKITKKAEGKAVERNPTSDEKALPKLRGTWKPEWVEMWRQSQLDFNFMDHLLLYLKVEDTSKYLPLNDLDHDTYRLFKEIWTQHPRKFMLGQFWVGKVLGTAETHRRLQTMINQISELTIIENWKIIKNELMMKKQLTKAEVRKIENFYKLSIRFPNPMNVSSIPSSSLKLHKKDLLAEIEKALGIKNSKRPHPVPLNEYNKEQTLVKLQTELYLASRYSGIDVLKVKEIVDFHFGVRDIIKVSANDFISLENSAERNWLLEKAKIPLNIQMEHI